MSFWSEAVGLSKTADDTKTFQERLVRLLVQGTVAVSSASTPVRPPLTDLVGGAV